MRHTILDFFKLIDNNQDKLRYCPLYNDVKIRELHILVFSVYTRSELSVFFHDTLKGDIRFRRFILENYNKVNSVNELVDMSCMSKSLFFSKFKSEFGMTAKKWMTKRLNERIRLYLGNSEISIKDMVYKLNFSSQAHFTRYCVQHFGITPRELIKKHAAG